jgi:hypothetical protein
MVGVCMLREVFNLSEGPVSITFPASLSMESYRDLVNQLDLILRRINRLAGINQQKLVVGSLEHTVEGGFGSLLQGTIKDRVLAVLERNPNGLTSSQILLGLKGTGLPLLTRESLSPQLSRLRHRDQKIDLNNGIWTLKKG